MSKENINDELQKIMLHTEDLKKTLKEMEVYNDLLKWVATKPHTFTTIMNGQKAVWTPEKYSGEHDEYLLNAYKTKSSSGKYGTFPTMFYYKDTFMSHKKDIGSQYLVAGRKLSVITSLSKLSIIDDANILISKVDKHQYQVNAQCPEYLSKFDLDNIYINKTFGFIQKLGSSGQEIPDWIEHYMLLK